LVIDDREKVEPYFSSLLSQGRLQTAAREANSSGPQKHVVNDEKYNIEKKLQIVFMKNLLIWKNITYPETIA